MGLGERGPTGPRRDPRLYDCLATWISRTGATAPALEYDETMLLASWSKIAFTAF